MAAVVGLLATVSIVGVRSLVWSDSYEPGAVATTDSDVALFLPLMVMEQLDEQFDGDSDETKREQTLRDLIPSPADYPPIPEKYQAQVASGKAINLLKAARSQLGMPYLYGAGPRDPDGLARLGTKPYKGGFDCSTFVAYAFQVGVGDWISGTIAHTDQIWTQGGQLPLDMSPGETSKIIRGTGAKPPPHGYRPGDILEMRWGAGGYFGHVVIVSEHGLTIQAFGSDVYETDPITRFLADGDELGWVRVKSLSA